MVTTASEIQKTARLARDRCRHTRDDRDICTTPTASSASEIANSQGRSPENTVPSDAVAATATNVTGRQHAIAAIALRAAATGAMFSECLTFGPRSWLPRGAAYMLARFGAQCNDMVDDSAGDDDEGAEESQRTMPRRLVAA
jgi:hypothetical protein